MHILVIGSEGFIGGSIIDYYTRKGVKVTGIDNKMSANKTGYNYFQVLSFNYTLENILQSKPDVCIFAAGSANVQLSVTQPHLDFESNVVSVSRILNSLLKFSPACKFVHISSAAVYGNPAELPVKETSRIQPLSPYGWHKRQAELLCEEYFTSFGLPACSIRPFSVYGEGQKKLLFWDLFHKFNSAESSVELFGSGNESRDFIHISDFLNAIDLILHKGNFQADIYNIAGGEETSIQRAAETFRQVMHSSKLLTFNQKERTGDPVHWKADISKLKALGFRPAMSLESGLSNYYTWIKENT